MPETCHGAVSRPNRNSLQGLRRYHGKAGASLGKLLQKGFRVLKLFRALKGAQNVPRGSFEAQ